MNREPYQDYDQPIPELSPAETPPTMVICPGCRKTVYEDDCIVCRDEEGPPRCWCVDCHRQRPAKVRQEKKAAKSAEQFRAIIRAVGQSSAATISDLCLTLINRFGGISGFAEFYHTELTKAAVATPGSAKVLNACAGIAKIVAASTVYQASLPDVARLTDQQLCDEWERGMREVISKIPKQELLDLAEDVQHEKTARKTRQA